MAVNAEFTRELEELIAALDRRLPRADDPGEAGIARDAATLRAKASERHSGSSGQRVSPAAEGLSGPRARASYRPAFELSEFHPGVHRWPR